MNKEALLNEQNHQEEPDIDNLIQEKEPDPHAFEQSQDRNTTKIAKSFKTQENRQDSDDSEDLEETNTSTTLIKKCIPIPQVKVQPYLFHNALFNPQFDTFNPIFGIIEGKKQSCKSEGDEENKMEDRCESKVAENEESDIELARLFATKESLNFNVNKRIMAHIPLKKIDLDPRSNLEEEKYLDLKNEDDKQSCLQSVKDMYREIMKLLVKIILVTFIFNVLPVFIRMWVNHPKYLGINSFDENSQIMNFCFDILSFVLLIFLIKHARNDLQSKSNFQFNLNPEFNFGAILSDLPESTTMYDIIKITRKLLGPNYGIIDIVMVNDYSELEKAHHYVKEKEMLRWNPQTRTIENYDEMLEDVMKGLEEMKKKKILEEKKIIKLGARFQGAAIVIFQTQEIAEIFIKKLSPCDPFILYSHTRDAVIGGSKISVEEYTEPRDLLWENLGINKRLRKFLIIFFYLIIMAVLWFVFQPIIGNSITRVLKTYDIDSYVVFYVFPLIAVLFCYLAETPLMFVGKLLRFFSYSAENGQIISFSFALFLGSFISVMFRAMGEGPTVFMDGSFADNDNGNKLWHIHFSVGLFLAIAITTPFKRIWNKGFLTNAYRKIVISYKKKYSIPFSRLEYEKSLETPSFDWIIPLHSIMMILSYLFVVKEICFFGCFLACLLVVLSWVVDKFFIENTKIDLMTVMVLKSFFKILDVMVIMLACSNGIINILGSLRIGGSDIIFGILWLMFVGCWMYYEFAFNIQINCFNFQIAKLKKKILEASKLKFLPEKKRRNVINIDRNMEFSNSVETETVT